MNLIDYTSFHAVIKGVDRCTISSMEVSLAAEHFKSDTRRLQLKDRLEKLITDTKKRIGETQRKLEESRTKLETIAVQAEPILAKLEKSDCKDHELKSSDLRITERYWKANDKTISLSHVLGLQYERIYLAKNLLSKLGVVSEQEIEIPGVAIQTIDFVQGIRDGTINLDNFKEVIPNIPDNQRVRIKGVIDRTEIRLQDELEKLRSLEVSLNDSVPRYKEHLESIEQKRIKLISAISTAKVIADCLSTKIKKSTIFTR